MTNQKQIEYLTSINKNSDIFRMIIISVIILYIAEKFFK